MSKKAKICFQLLDAYSLFNKNTKYSFGGAETRAFIILNALAANSFDVNAIVRDYGQKPIEAFNKIKVYAHPYHTNNKVANPGILNRILNLRFSGTQQEEHLKYDVYKQTGADIYCAFEITSASKMLAEYCIKNDKIFYLFIASDGEVSGDFSEDSSKEPFTLNRALANYVINSAGKVFVQNNKQKEKLAEHFNKTAILIKNPVVLDTQVSGTVKNYDFLWVGKSNHIKRPLLFVQMALQMPSHSFCMVVNPSQKEIHDRIYSEKPANLKIIEQLNTEEMEGLFGISKIFVSTSLLEGFPNTFLQAAKHRLPVISMLVNPDNYITEYSCGLCTGDDMNSLVANSQLLIKNTEQTKQFGQNAYAYVKANHDAEKIIQQLTPHFLLN